MTSTKQNQYLPIFELTRENVVESIHFGAIAVVDVSGRLIASYGDPKTVTFLRSSLKPFQALPFFENKGPQVFDLTDPEKAIICASHTGTDEHVATVRSLQKKAGVQESELLCSIHEPIDKQTATRMRVNHEPVTPNRHNCSGKHTGMLAFLRLTRQSGAALPGELTYIDPIHPLQKEILQTFADMCGLPVEKVGLGVDGCSAPNFAVPLVNTAFAFARLCDPVSGGVQPATRVYACREIVHAMTSSPEMISGPGHFDTRLMKIAEGKIVSKGGAEGYQGVGILPGTLGKSSPALGIAIKISDGDSREKVRSAVTLEVLRQLGALSEAQLAEISEFGPKYRLENLRGIHVGDGYPTFQLVDHAPIKIT